MGARGPATRLATVAVEEAEQCEDRSLALARYIRRAVENDGAIDLDEAREILYSADQLVTEAREVVTAAMRVDVMEKAAANLLTGRISPHVRQQMRDVGIVLPFPPDDGPRAA